MTFDLDKTCIKNIYVSVLFDRTQRSSFCWEYFGNLVVITDNKQMIVNEHQVYCIACLNKVKAECDEVNYGSVKIKAYNKTVSTGNLTRHLRDDHQIQDDRYTSRRRSKRNEKSPEPPIKIKREIEEDTRTSEKNEQKHDKWLLARDMAIWYCKSLLPFDTLCDYGAIDFFKKYNIIIDDEDLPSPNDVSRVALDNIYDCMTTNLKTKICLDSVQYGTLAMDSWTDRYRRLNYITYTFHYLNVDFGLIYHTLSTRMVDENQADKEIEGMIANIKNTYNLNDINIRAVINTNGKVMQAVKLANMNHQICIGQGFHNLVTIDGVKGDPDIRTLVKKCKRIVKAISYRVSDLEAHANKKEMEFIGSLDSVIQSLESDEIDPLPEGFPTGVSVKDEDKAIPTRWHCILEMLENVTFFDDFKPINKILTKIGADDLIEEIEWHLLEELVKFLKGFREAVEVMTSQSTCNMNVVLLFRSEIIDVLNSDNSEDESLIMSRLKHKMLRNIDRRLPVTKTVAAAALLDCRFMNLKEVDKYLKSENMNKSEFLSSCIKEFLGDLGPVVDDVEKPRASTSSNDTSLLHRLSIKHRVNDVQDDPVDQECWRYVASADSTTLPEGDILSYWNKNKTIFPTLSVLAKVLLSMPATCAPSERMFSSVGLSISTKRSRINPTKVDKVMFIHDNCKDINFLLQHKVEVFSIFMEEG